MLAPFSSRSCIRAALSLREVLINTVIPYCRAYEDTEIRSLDLERRDFTGMRHQRKEIIRHYEP
jgi:hypothetical protein